MLNKIKSASFLFLWLTVSVTGVSQTNTTRQRYDSNQSINYGFVSPNTAENLTLQLAIRNLSSSEEVQLINKANDLGCRMHTRVRAMKALGSWRDGAEHSILLLTLGDEASIRYFLSKLGRDARQKGVLYFHGQRGGFARLYILFPRQKVHRLNSLATTLDALGIDSRTLVPLKHATAIYIVDTRGDMVPKVRTLEKRLRAKMQVQVGTAKFIGDEVSREKAADVFQGEITNYESTHSPLQPTCRAGHLGPMMKKFGKKS
ncbi:MAG TPA: hypothetical protein VIV66_02295 [Pyrinomonadaceae bacterium]